MATTKYLDYAGLQRYHGKLKTDVITPINNRIDEIVNVGGQPNVIEAVKINNNTFAIADKTASLAMNLTYDSTAKKIKLAIGSETQEIDATDFIKDGMLDNATYNAENKKLTLTFNTASGKSAIDVDLTDLVDTYALSAGTATAGTYLTLTPGVSGTGSTSDPWKVTVALDETNLTTELTNIKENVITTLSNTSQAGNVNPFAIYYGKSLGSNITAGGSVQISGLKVEGLTKADTATYETLTVANTGSTFENVMQKFLANDIDLNTRLASVEGTVGGLGSAATKDESYFAKAVHEHRTSDVVTNQALEVDPDQTTVATSIVGGAIIDKLFTQLLTNDSLLNTRLTTVEGTVGGLGSASTKDESYFAKAVHTHKTSEVANDAEITCPDNQTEIVKSLDAGWTVNNDLSRLLANDSLLNIRLASVEGTVGGLGSAATKDETYFAKAAHTHATTDISTDGPLSVNSVQTTVLTSVEQGAGLNQLFTQLLTNDSLLANAQIEYIDWEYVCGDTYHDIDAIGGMAINEEKKAYVRGILERAIANGTTAGFSTRTYKYILSNITKDLGTNEIYANMGVDDNGLPKYRFTFGGGMLHVGFFKTREEATIRDNEIDALFA